jgi:hypothetical protein
MIDEKFETSKGQHRLYDLGPRPAGVFSSSNFQEAR